MARNYPATALGFMYVCSIVKSSAADQGGLKCGDIIVQFGPFNKNNFGGLRDIPPFVHENVKTPISITVLRRSSCKRGVTKGYKTLSLRATPAQWSEGAVLGCVLNTWPPPLPVHSPTSSPSHASRGSPIPHPSSYEGERTPIRTLTANGLQVQREEDVSHPSQSFREDSSFPSPSSSKSSSTSDSTLSPRHSSHRMRQGPPLSQRTPLSMSKIH
jgi:hypothetical protein